MSSTAKDAGTSEETKFCFVISPIGSEESDERKHSDQVLKHLIRKTLEAEPFKYTVKRADEIDQPGMITVQIIERLLTADLVVADLTGQNANVFYELAIRHAAKKPIVHLYKSGETLPFDVSQLRAIKYDLSNPDSLESAGKSLQEQVLTLEQGGEILTPVQLGQIITSLVSGSSRDDKITTLLTEISRSLSHVASRVEVAAQYAEFEKQMLASPKTFRQLAFAGELSPFWERMREQVGKVEVTEPVVPPVPERDRKD